MYNAPLVVRAYFDSRRNAEHMAAELDGLGSYGDVMRGEPRNKAAWRVIFTATDRGEALQRIAALSIQPAFTEVFDVTGPWPSNQDEAFVRL